MKSKFKASRQACIEESITKNQISMFVLIKQYIGNKYLIFFHVGRVNTLLIYAISLLKKNKGREKKRKFRSYNIYRCMAARSYRRNRYYALSPSRRIVHVPFTLDTCTSVNRYRYSAACSVGNDIACARREEKREEERREGEA